MTSTLAFLRPRAHLLLLAARPLSSAAELASSPIGNGPIDSNSDPSLPLPPSLLRNVAIVAHVDHGKTTLVDKLLEAAQDATGGTGGTDRLMDSGDLEKERGITIMSKVTRVGWGEQGHVINITDTPGHADFGGEVERIMSMVDGVVLVVDATEGPKAQTKFVLSKALDAGLSPLLVLNKADRPTSRLQGDCESEIFDLFASLGADDEQLDYPTYFASAAAGWVTDDVDAASAWSQGEAVPADVQARGLSPLLDALIEHVDSPSFASNENDELGGGGVDEALRSDPAFIAEAPFGLAVNSVSADTFLGRLATGRIISGSVSPGDSCETLARGAADDLAPGETCPAKAPPARVQGVFYNRGLERVPLERPAGAGDIVTVAGVDCDVGDTITLAQPAERRMRRPLVTPPLAPPTLSMTVGPNTGPLQGKEGSKVTGSAIKDRLLKETDNNVTIDVVVDGERCEVFGRGELQLGILLEQMRREGFEMCVSPPKIVVGEDGQEPIEEVFVDVDQEYVGTIINLLTGSRKGFIVDQTEDLETGRCAVTFHVPTRGLLGFNAEAASATRGSAVVNHLFLEMRPHMGELGGDLSPGKLVATGASGSTTSYALNMVQERGELFVDVGEEVYEGMVIGENARADDIDVNPVRAKAVNNIRTVLKEDKAVIQAPKRRSLEEYIAYMGQDEMLEVTPKNIRLRKSELDPKKRLRLARDKKNASKKK